MLPAEVTTAAEAAARVASEWSGARGIVTYAVRVDDAEQFLELREALAKDGYRRLVIGGSVRDIDDVRPSEVTAPDVRVEVVVDRVAVTKVDARRLQAAIEVAWERGGGRAELRRDGARPALAERGLRQEDPTHVPVARGLVCRSCARSFEPARAALFSYNSPLGACDGCRGFGRTISVDWEKVIPDPRKTLKNGAIKPWNGASSEWEREILAKFARKQKIPLDLPWEELTDAQRAKVLDGEGTWEGGKYPGVRAWFKWLEGRTYKMHVRVLLARYREYVACTACQGSRLNASARSYRVAHLDMAGWHGETVALSRARGSIRSSPAAHRGNACGTRSRRG